MNRWRILVHIEVDDEDDLIADPVKVVEFLSDPRLWTRLKVEWLPAGRPCRLDPPAVGKRWCSGHRPQSGTRLWVEVWVRPIGPPNLREEARRLADPDVDPPAATSPIWAS